MSNINDHDKAVEYDRIAGYLRKQGWLVVREWRHPVDGTVHENWRHKDDASERECDLMAALTMERWKDAPKQGERMTQTLEALSHTIDAKREAAYPAVVDFVSVLDRLRAIETAAIAYRDAVQTKREREAAVAGPSRESDSLREAYRAARDDKKAKGEALFALLALVESKKQ